MRRGFLLALVCVVSAVVAAPAGAQHFGRNKVEYVDFDFKILETEHFDIHYYDREEEAARLAARLAERWYARLATMLGHRLTGRQPLILYASQPEFAQTNVVSSFLGEGIGGVTESAKRRIVMPFAPTLAETDQILGHEIVHAFQFDITRRQRGGLSWPLWAVEGMAQYLTAGADDGDAALWLRDAVTFELLPDERREAERAFSPYKYGHAMWAYLAGRFGDRVVADVLKTTGSIEKRLKHVTGVEADGLYASWRAAAQEHFADGGRLPDVRGPLLREQQRGRYHLGPALSPDGHRAVFFSERDRLSIDLYLADTGSGVVEKKLLTTTGSARFESLQAIRSAGAWNARGDRFVFSAVEHGQPALVVLDMTQGREETRVRLPETGQIFTPSWSPDGGRIVFAALAGGSTDLYVYSLASGRVERLTDDVFADLQPAWSPDGREIAFATDRFSSDPAALAFGRPELALLDVATRQVRRVAAFDGARHFNPQWSGCGRALYFVADPAGARNVYRVDLPNGALSQVTFLDGGVTGLAPNSPAMSVALNAPVLAMTVFRAGRFELEIRRGGALLEGTSVARSATAARRATLPPAVRIGSGAGALAVPAAAVDDDGGEPRVRAYNPRLFVEAIGQPTLSSGGGPYGSYWSGGGSVLFSDLLGERKALAYAQVSNRLSEMAFGIRYLNRERRWNWGVNADLQPSLRRLPRRRIGAEEGVAAVTSETVYFDRSQVSLGGTIAYPFNQAQRIEFDAGARYTQYRQSVVSTVRSLETGKLLERSTVTGTQGAPATVGEFSAAFVTDTAVFGPAGPIVGGRSRFEIAGTAGELNVARLTVDYRRYVMPVKPYTIAARALHTGYYGRDADDPRLLPAFLGSRAFVRGYGWSALHCPRDVEGECAAYEELLGSRVLVGNVEVRFPIAGVLARDIRYGPIPVEGFLFADAGVVWSRGPMFTAARSDRQFVSSFGAGIRLAAFLPLELSVVRAVSRLAEAWSFDMGFRMGF